MFSDDYREPDQNPPESGGLVWREPAVYLVKIGQWIVKYVCAGCATKIHHDHKTRISEGRRREMNLKLCDDCQKEF